MTRRPAFFRCGPCWGLLMALAMLPGSALAAGAQRERIAIYSSFCWHVEAGDLLGYRILIPLDVALDFAGARHFVMFQEASGEPQRPVVADHVAINGRAIEFDLQLGQPTVFHFKGTITPQLIEGRFTGSESGDFGGDLLRLRRQTNQASQVPDCR